MGLFAENLVVATLANWRKIAPKDLSVVRSTIFSYAENADESISFKAVDFINSLKGGVEINISTPPFINWLLINSYGIPKIKNVLLPCFFLQGG